jgi:hypothetical protein
MQLGKASWKVSRLDTKQLDKVYKCHTLSAHNLKPVSLKFKVTEKENTGFKLASLFSLSFLLY